MALETMGPRGTMALRMLRWLKLDTKRLVATSGASTASIKDLGTVRVRFAPSPTGFVHIGSLRTIAYNYLFARSKPGGRFILRIEDTDQQRIVPGAQEQLEATLEWLGMEPDESPSKGGPVGPYVQSKRLELYREAAKKLLDEGKAYRCFCSAERLMLMKKEALKNRESIRYDNFCRTLTQDQINQKMKAGIPYGLRFILQQEPSSFDDVTFGHHVDPVAEREGDPVIMKSDGYPTYHFANVVDDHHMRVSHVIRGEEWLMSTVKHLQLYQAFGWQPPIFAHIPVMTGKGRAKLSKRDASANLDTYRQAGYYALPLINCVLSTGGGFDHDRKDKNRLYTLDQLTEIFDLQRLNSRATKFEPEFLEKYNQIFIKNRSRIDLIADMRRLITSRLGESIENESLDETYLNRIFDQYLADNRLTTLVQLFENPDHAFLWRHDQDLHPDLKKSITFKGETKEPEEIATYLERLMIDFDVYFDRLPDQYTIDGIRSFLADFEKRSGVNHRLAYHVIRLMITKTTKGLPIAEMFFLLGKDRVIRRLKNGIDWMRSISISDKAAKL